MVELADTSASKELELVRDKRSLRAQLRAAQGQLIWLYHLASDWAPVGTDPTLLSRVQAAADQARSERLAD